MDEDLHRTRIISGRMRGQWFAQCTCGWEGAPSYNETRAKLDTSEHRVSRKLIARFAEADGRE